MLHKFGGGEIEMEIVPGSWCCRIQKPLKHLEHSRGSVNTIHGRELDFKPIDSRSRDSKCAVESNDSRVIFLAALDPMLAPAISVAR
jgi:hypothetical protein